MIKISYSGYRFPPEIIVLVLIGVRTENVVQPEVHILGGHYPESDARDQDIINKTITAFPASAKVKARMLDRFEVEAYGIVWCEKPAIEMIAAALVKHGKLSGREIDDLINNERWSRSKTGAAQIEKGAYYNG